MTAPPERSAARRRDVGGGRRALRILLRPRLRGLSRQDWAWLAGLAATMGLMNFFFYLSIDRIPLGEAVTFELVGPLILSAARARRPRALAFTALAFGKPMLLTDVGGFPEVAATGAAAIVPPGDPDALAAELEALLGDPARLERMAAASRAAAEGEYGWDDIAQRTLALYASLRR